MRKLAVETHKNRTDLFNATATKMEMNKAIIEKDFWVCWMLDILFTTSSYSTRFAFKGGTSLSKGYDAIARFSEDIDLILDWRVIGIGIDEPWQLRSKTKQDIFNKETNKKTADFLRDIFLEDLRSDIEAEGIENWELSIDPGDPNTIQFSYPQLFQDDSLVQEIRLEIGCLASWSPTKTITIEPYTAHYYPQLFSASSVGVRTVEAKRTFWEKATILHKEAHRARSSSLPARYSRHYYDLYMLLRSVVKDEAVRDFVLLDQVAKFKEKFYICNWAKYNEATFDTIRLCPQESFLQVLERDYDNMQNMIYGEKIPWKDILKELKEFETFLRGIN